MKLIKFRIKCYKSIKDSGYCWLASDLTILAGKNESGKTALLEALSDFNTKVENLSQEAFPLDESGTPLLELCFDPTDAILQNVAEKTKSRLPEKAKEQIKKAGLTVFKDCDGDYSLDPTLIAAIDENVKTSNQFHLGVIRDAIAKLETADRPPGFELPKLDGSIESVKAEVSKFLALNWVASLPDAEKRKKIELLYEKIRKETSELINDMPSEKFEQEILEYLPTFIFFSDFSDILPFEMTFADAKRHQAVKDFAKVSGLDLTAVEKAATNTQLRRNILSKHSATITGDFMSYWEQSKIELVAEPDGVNLRIGIREQGSTMLFKTEQRSKGFQWFLSFYLRLQAEKAAAKIILIDEPGLYLHAKAQGDVLKLLEKLSGDTQVVISTHSPYLIDADRLDRIRLVTNNEDGTKVENKIHKGVDTETLTPIITAIGLDLNSGFSIAGKRNVLLEGISDYYFMQALKEYLPDVSNTNVNFIPCVGASKIPQLASLLIGWGLDFIVVLDKDREGKRIATELRERLSISEDRIIFVSLQDEKSIEDLFTQEDFKSFVLNNEGNGNGSTSNSKLIKEMPVDKVLLSKKFFERVQSNKSEISLSDASISAFKSIFERISNNL